MNRLRHKSRLLRTAGFIGVILSIVILYTCAALAQLPIVKSPGDSTKQTFVALPFSTVSDNLDPRAFSDYVNGLLLSGFGDLESAARFFERALAYYPESYEIAISLAETYYESRQPEKALDVLTRIPKRDAQVYLLSAACYRTLGDDDKAKSAYLRYTELDPANPMVLSYLADLYMRAKNVDSAIWAYSLMAHNATPDNFRVWNELGRLQAQHGDFDSAKASFRKSVELDQTPTNSMAVVSLGELYEQTGKLDSAESTFKLGLEIEPDNVLLHRELVAHYVRMDSLALALPHAKAVAELTPLDRTAIRRLALIYFGLDSLDQADSLFTYLAGSGEQAAGDYAYMGHIAVIKKQYQRAVYEFTKLTDLADSVYDGWLNLGFAYRMVNDTAKELLSYQEGIRHVKDTLGVLRLNYALGAAYDLSGHTDSAVALFEKIIAHDSTQSEAYNDLGYMLADHNQRLDYAKELIARAVSLQPDNPAYLDSYGWVYYRLGDIDKALEYLRKASEKAKDPTVFEHMGDAFKAANQPDSAKVWWDKALKLSPDSKSLKEKLGR
ncbi:MAG TPA: tetratricopeptide repeat protein [Candidatus Acidoferrum sp.]|nr:tetratricopeptide repeat protein [Candidatus Acidoferrum sp.]